MSAASKCERVGATLHCPPGERAEFVRALLRFLEERGFEAAPRFLGVDEQGRDVLTFVDGYVASDLDVRRWTLEQIEAAFALLRRFHDVTAGSHIAGSAEVVCHNDFTPQNTVFRDGRPVALIDWEFAAPGSRRRDLAHGLWQWLNLGADGPPFVVQPERIRRVLRSYGLSDTDWIVPEIRAREAEWLEFALRAAVAGHDTMHRTPAHWSSAAAWVSRELAWLDEHADTLASALSE